MYVLFVFKIQDVKVKENLENLETLRDILFKFGMPIIYVALKIIF